MYQNICDSHVVIRKEHKNLTRTIRRVGKRVVAARLGFVVATMTIASLSQGGCQTAGEQQRR